MSKSTRTSNIVLFTSLTVACTCFASWIVWNYFKKKKEKATRPYELHRTIYLAETAQQWDDRCIHLLNDLKDVKVLGLDCEWVLKNRVALLQLASASDTCMLVCLNKLTPTFPKSLRTLLADKSILKVGVAVVDDAQRLERDYGLKVNGCVDLRHILKRVKHNFYCPSRGLQGLAKGVLGVDIDKNKNIRCGNWEAEQLSYEQIQYAAKDAAVAVDIFCTLVNTKMQMSHTAAKSVRDKIDSASEQGLHIEHSQKTEETHHPNIPEITSIKWIQKFWKVALSMCQGLIDCSYATRVKHLEVSSAKPRELNRKKVKLNCYSTRQRPLWDNCRLEAPDGELLCTCDMKKTQWYLDNKLADKVCEDPLTVRLRFEPANRPQSERNYYLHTKENVCVVCGHDKDYVRKFIVPCEYRKYLPEQLKDHSSHDVLLLCTACHRQSCESDIHLRLQLAQECNAPLECGASAKVVLDEDAQKVRSAARALKVSRHKMPEKRVLELESMLTKYFNVEALSDELIESASTIDASFNKEDYIPHGKKVVEHVKKCGDLLAFQARWRQHFLDTMTPKFLPSFWSVDYVPESWIHQKPSEV